MTMIGMVAMIGQLKAVNLSFAGTIKSKSVNDFNQKHGLPTQLPRSGDRYQKQYRRSPKLIKKKKG